LVVMLAMTTAVSAAGDDDFAGNWTAPDLVDFREITYRFESLGAGVYSVRVDIGQSAACGGGHETLVDTAAVVVAGVLHFDLVLVLCADGSMADGTVFPDRTATPQSDGTLLVFSPSAGDLRLVRGVAENIIGPIGRVCFAVAGSPGDAAIVNLTPVEARGAGNGQLISSDVVTPPVASNVNYGVGTVDPNVAVAKIGTDGEVCYVNSKHTSVHLVADHLGTIAAASYTPATVSGAPDRKVDTRIGKGGTTVGPSGRLCFAVAGLPGDAAIVNLTPVQAQGAGNGQLISSDVATPPVASNVNFGPGTIDPNVAVAPIGTDGKVCYSNSVHTSVDLVADHLGTIAADAYTTATPSGAPDRKVDTRTGKGGPIVGPSGRLCFAAAGSPGDVALVNLTPVLAQGSGNGQLVSSDVTSPPVASNVNYGPGSVDPNVAAALIGTDGKVCYANSVHTSVHLIADHLGTIAASAYTPATPGGAPDRKVDTRIG